MGKSERGTEGGESLVWGRAIHWNRKALVNYTQCRAGKDKPADQAIGFGSGC